MDEKHCLTKVTITLEKLCGLWEGASVTDKQRLEMIKSVIWTSNNAHSFFQKAKKLVNSKKFKETLTRRDMAHQ